MNFQEKHSKKAFRLHTLKAFRLHTLTMEGDILDSNP